MSNEIITEAVIQPAKQRGRPLAFNQDEALDKALNVFWLRGYEGATMAELTEALGINKPSIYAAFGNKEELFRKALAKYLAGPAAFVGESLNETTARQVATHFLTRAAEFLTHHNNPRGCMVVQGALSCGAGSAAIQQVLIAHRKSYENALVQRFELAKAQGDLPADVNCASLAKYLTTIHQGLSVQATSGATCDELKSVIQIAMQNWPTKH
ncbi:MAG: TetR/AcrR family transcriptional regulator [Methylotenera sp.]